MKKILDVGPENLKTEECIKTMARIFAELDIKVINNWFKKMELPQFNTVEAAELPELCREEQIMNLCERFDKFACDSDNE